MSRVALLSAADFPARQHPVNLAPHFSSSQLPVAMLHQQLIIARVFVADVRNDGQPQCLRIEFFCRSRTADATGMFPARPGGDARGFICRATREQSPQLFRDVHLIFVIRSLPSFRRAFALPGALLLVGQAFCLGTINGFRRDQDTLPLVTLPRPRPLHHHGAQRRMFGGAPRQCGVAGGKKFQMPEVCAVQA